MFKSAEVTVIHFSSKSFWRGGEQQITFLIEEYKQLGIGQVLLCPENSLLHRRMKNTVRCFTFTKLLNIDPICSGLLAAICKKHPHAVVHVHDSTAHTIAVISGVFFFNRTPVVLSRRVDFEIKPGFLSTFKYNYPTVKSIICVSRSIQSVIQVRIRDNSKLVTILSGIDVEFHAGVSKNGLLKERYNLPLDAILVGNTAALAPHKDYYTFVDTADLLVKSDKRFRFFIIGDGPEYKSIRSYIRKKGLHEYIAMTGFLEEASTILPELDFFLMTSRSEGLGTSIMNAFACKVPVISTDAGGIPEIITDKETGLLAPVRNARALADHVLRLVDDPELKDSIVARAYQRIQEFSKKQTAKQTLEIYRKVLNGSDILLSQTRSENPTTDVLRGSPGN